MELSIPCYEDRHAYVEVIHGVLGHLLLGEFQGPLEPQIVSYQDFIFSESSILLASPHCIAVQ